MSLKARLAAEIAASGPISVAEYMTRCLHDPAEGYYATRPALGEAGDFLTAPLVSQMFGELIGAWLVETWRGLGAPRRFVLAEAGPGDGTLMADVLRVASAVPDFCAAAELWLLEASALLKARQAVRLAAFSPKWATSLAALPTDAPLLVIANEFLDCLPIRQFERTALGWAERVIGLAADGALGFGLRPAPPLNCHAPVGAVVERSPAAEAFVAELAGRIAEQDGAALLIDYGAIEPGAGDTLQALAGHRKVDPLAEPGAADLTAHVGFAALMGVARNEGCEVGVMRQRELLARLGIEARAAALSRVRSDQAATIARQLGRLTSPDQMGELFKAVAVWTGFAPPAFEIGP